MNRDSVSCIRVQRHAAACSRDLRLVTVPCMTAPGRAAPTWSVLHSRRVPGSKLTFCLCPVSHPLTYDNAGLFWKRQPVLSSRTSRSSSFFLADSQQPFIRRIFQARYGRFRGCMPDHNTVRVVSVHQSGYRATCEPARSARIAEVCIAVKNSVTTLTRRPLQTTHVAAKDRINSQARQLTERLVDVYHEA